MTPLLTALGFIALYLFLPKNKNPGYVAIQTSPVSSGVGINTGFTAPPISTGLIDTSATQKNQPSTSGSGVPDYTALVQASNQGMPVHVPGVSLDSFYGHNPMVSTLPSSRTRQSMQEKTGCECEHRPNNDCGIQHRRTASSGCLAPSRAAQIKNTPDYVIAQFASNVKSVDFTPFQATQQMLYDRQLNSSNTDDNTIPVNPHHQLFVGRPAGEF